MDDIKDIIQCIITFAENESIESKGKYFEIIQNDLKKLVNAPKFLSLKEAIIFLETKYPDFYTK